MLSLMKCFKQAESRLLFFGIPETSRISQRTLIPPQQETLGLFDLFGKFID
jgi:hypothetical protein